jgi:hypothetical protein
MFLLPDLNSLLGTQAYYLIVGVILISAATGWICMGKVWVRFNGWVYRAKEPRMFWEEVVLYYLGGAWFVGCFLYKTY